MTRLLVLRTASWLVPLVLVYLLIAWKRPRRSLAAGVLLSTAWNLWAVLAVNIAARELGWWGFPAGLPSFMGVPVEAWLGWVLLWGAVVPLAAHDRPIVVAVVSFLWIDLIAMPLMDPFVILGDDWLVGEVVALAVALVPGVLLARWTAGDSHLYRRVALQVVCAGALMMWLVPSVALGPAGGWRSLVATGSLPLALLAQVALVPTGLAVRAVIEFARRGEGTPVPYDPPKRLVTSGPYSYVANPMQLSMVVLFFVGAVALRNVWMGAAAVTAVAYSAGLATWHEGTELEERFGDGWRRYRAAVRPWAPRLRPYVPVSSRLLVAYSCGVCSSIGRWFVARAPVGLEIAPAEDATEIAPMRVTYVPGDGGPPSVGVAAIARALEHLHLGWAVAGWLLALPGVVQLAQVVVDIWGPAPQRVAGMSYDPNACDPHTRRAHA